MKLVYVNADNGIPVFGDKGASVHIQEMVRAFVSLDCGVRILTARLGSSPAEDLAALTVEAAAMAGVPLAGTNWVPGS